jgi:hypothetical protein
MTDDPGVKALRTLVDEVEDLCRTYTGRDAGEQWIDTLARFKRLDRLVKKIRKTQAQRAKAA